MVKRAIFNGEATYVVYDQCGCPKDNKCAWSRRHYCPTYKKVRAAEKAAKREREAAAKAAAKEQRRQRRLKKQRVRTGLAQGTIRLITTAPGAMRILRGQQAFKKAWANWLTYGNPLSRARAMTALHEWVHGMAQYDDSGIASMSLKEACAFFNMPSCRCCRRPATPKKTVRFSPDTKTWDSTPGEYARRLRRPRPVEPEPEPVPEPLSPRQEAAEQLLMGFSVLCAGDQLAWGKIVADFPHCHEEIEELVGHLPNHYQFVAGFAGPRMLKMIAEPTIEDFVGLI